MKFLKNLNLFSLINYCLAVARLKLNCFRIILEFFWGTILVIFWGKEFFLFCFCISDSFWQWFFGIILSILHIYIRLRKCVIILIEYLMNLLSGHFVVLFCWFKWTMGIMRDKLWIFFDSSLILTLAAVLTTFIIFNSEENAWMLNLFISFQFF